MAGLSEDMSFPQWKKELLLRRRAVSRTITAGGGGVKLRVSRPSAGSPSVPLLQSSGPSPSRGPPAPQPGSNVGNMRFLDQLESSCDLIKCTTDSDTEVKAKMVEEKPDKKPTFRTMEKPKEIRSTPFDDKKEDEDYHSDSSEELQYGPGIVNKLKSKYMSMTLRDNQKHSARPSLSNLRRATSLENMLDDDSNKQKPHFKKNPYHITTYRSSKISQHHAKYLGISRGSESMKRARSMDTLIKNDSKPNNTMSNSYTNGSVTPSIINEDIIIVDNTDSFEDSKVLNKSEDTELPPHDLVKQTLKLFETSVSKKPPSAQSKVKIAVSKISNSKPPETLNLKQKLNKPTLSPKPVITQEKRYARPKVASPKRVIPVVSSIEKPKAPVIAPRVCSISESKKFSSPLITPKVLPLDKKATPLVNSVQKKIGSTEAQSPTFNSVQKKIGSPEPLSPVQKKISTPEPQSPTFNSVSKKLNSPEILSPTLNSVLKKVGSPEVLSPKKPLSPEILSPKKVVSPEILSPKKVVSPEILSPKKAGSADILSPKKTGSPEAQVSVFNTVKRVNSPELRSPVINSVQMKMNGSDVPKIESSELQSPTITSVQEKSSPKAPTSPVQKALAELEAHTPPAVHKNLELVTSTPSSHDQIDSHSLSLSPVTSDDEEKPKFISQKARDGISKEGMSMKFSFKDKPVASDKTYLPRMPQATNTALLSSQGETSPVKQVAVIRPVMKPKVLTDQEIEKNLINKVKTVESKLLKSDESGSDSNDVKSGQLWEKKSWQSQNTMVFNFSDRKSVPDYIENDGITLAPRRNAKGLNGEEGGDSGGPGATGEDDWDSPLTCNVRFIGDNILINGKSNLKKEPRASKLRIQFNDEATTLFEYPSEDSLVEESTTPSPVSSPPHTPSPLSLGGGTLSNYTPSKSLAGERFELGVTRSAQPNHHEAQPEQPKETKEEDYLKPMDPNEVSPWSQETTSDILF